MHRIETAASRGDNKGIVHHTWAPWELQQVAHTQNLNACAPIAHARLGATEWHGLGP